MKIQMNVADFNAIVKTCKPFVKKSDEVGAPKSMQGIELSVMQQRIRARAAYGTRGIEMFVPAFDDAEPGVMVIPLLPPIRVIRGFPIVELEMDDTGDNERSVTVRYGRTAATHEPFPQDFFDLGTVYPKELPKESFYLSPENTVEVFKAFGDEPSARVDYYGSVHPLVVQTANKRCILMPMGGDK